MIDMNKFSLTKHDPEIQELIAITDHKLLAKWAIDCLNRVLYIYKERYPKDDTPDRALTLLNDWIDDRITMWQARKYCWKVLERARSVEKEDKVSCQILRATSHCLATCHVKTHAEGTAMYVVSAIKYLDSDQNNLIDLMTEERKWQINHLYELRKEGNRDE